MEVINSAESAISGDIGQTPIKLSAEVCGLGPVFEIALTIVNMSTDKTAADLRVLIHANQNHYTMESAYQIVRVLLGITCHSVLNLNFNHLCSCL